MSDDRRLSRTRFQQIDALLDLALPLGERERRALLDERARDDAALRAEVERLLAAHEGAGDFLERPVDDLADVAGAGGEAPGLEGRSIGAYRVLRRIGSGGMGDVYLAERVDVGKRVALKLVRDGVASRALLERFLVERRLLARLDAPTIARLLDAGVTDWGAPYLIMEYVEGEPIDEYCDAHALDVEARLELLRTVCSTVQYAHQKLIVHCDLKPSNILVDSQGTPWLLDFGIARLVEPRADNGESASRALTPAYAAPEQIGSQPVTAATDVYALGVLLYELVAGQRPFGATEEATFPSTVEAREPVPPSEALRDGSDGPSSRLVAVGAARSTSPARLRRRLRGDVDAICRRALRADPEQRYPSAEQLAADIARHLAAQPVSARHPTAGYRAARFLRRHRLGVAAGFVAALSLCAGIVATWWQARIAGVERERAEQVATVLPELFWSLEPGELPGTAISPVELLGRGIDAVEARLADQPETLAQVLTVAADVYMRLAAFPDAERVARRALELRRALGPDDARSAASLAMLAQALDKQERYEEAEAMHLESLELRRAHLGRRHLEVATGLHNYALMLEGLGRYDESEEIYREALEMRIELGAPPRDIAFTLDNLGVVHYYQGRFEEAERVMREALAMRRETLGADHPDVAQSLHNLAATLAARGSDEDLEPLHREALEIIRRTHSPGHPLAAYAAHGLALVLHAKGRDEEAEELLAGALEIVMRAHGPGHPWTRTIGDSLAEVRTARARGGSQPPR